MCNLNMQMKISGNCIFGANTLYDGSNGINVALFETEGIT